MIAGMLFIGFISIINLLTFSYLLRKIEKVNIVHKDITEFRRELIVLASQRKRRF